MLGGLHIAMALWNTMGDLLFGSGWPETLNEAGLVKTRERERVRIFLFNDALNTFYLRLYGVIHMVKDHSDSEKGNPLPPHRLLLSINSKGSFICIIPHTTALLHQSWSTDWNEK